MKFVYLRRESLILYTNKYDEDEEYISCSNLVRVILSFFFSYYQNMIIIIESHKFHKNERFSISNFILLFNFVVRLILFSLFFYLFVIYLEKTRAK